MVGALGVAATGRNLVAHAHPFLEPRIVVADLVGERPADPVDLVDLDAEPRCRREAYQQPHRPAITVREIAEGEVFFHVRHAAPSRARRWSMILSEKSEV